MIIKTIAIIFFSSTLILASSVTYSNERIKVVTDVLEVEIDSKGGDIYRVVLRDYSVTAKNSEEKLVLMTDENINYHVAQSGLVSVNEGSAPSHNAIYRSEQNIYRLAEGEDTIEVPLYWANNKGVTVKKVLTFKRNNYVVDVNYYITAGEKNWNGSDYMQITRSRPVDVNDNAFIHTYTGGMVYSDEIKYDKYDFDDMAEANLTYQLTDGWLAMIQNYFLSAWIPETGKDNYYYSRYNRIKDHYTIGTRASAITIDAGQTGKISSQFVAASVNALSNSSQTKHPQSLPPSLILLKKILPKWYAEEKRRIKRADTWFKIGSDFDGTGKKCKKSKSPGDVMASSMLKSSMRFVDEVSEGGKIMEVSIDSPTLIRNARMKTRYTRGLERCEKYLRKIKQARETADKKLDKYR